MYAQPLEWDELVVGQAPRDPFERREPPGSLIEQALNRVIRVQRQYALADHQTCERRTPLGGEGTQCEWLPAHFGGAPDGNHFSRFVNRNSWELSAVAGASRATQASS